ncbi:MAG: hypothetical protein R3E95_18675 [Thiolinea sp.]
MDGAEDANGSGVVDAGETIPNPDSDQDGQMDRSRNHHPGGGRNQ